jgi:hypothetical protein
LHFFPRNSVALFAYTDFATWQTMPTADTAFWLRLRRTTNNAG